MIMILTWMIELPVFLKLIHLKLDKIFLYIDFHSIIMLLLCYYYAIIWLFYYNILYFSVFILLLFYYYLLF